MTKRKKRKKKKSRDSREWEKKRGIFWMEAEKESLGYGVSFHLYSLTLSTDFIRNSAIFLA